METVFSEENMNVTAAERREKLHLYVTVHQNQLAAAR